MDANFSHRRNHGRRRKASSSNKLMRNAAITTLTVISAATASQLAAPASASAASLPHGGSDHSGGTGSMASQVQRIIDDFSNAQQSEACVDGRVHDAACWQGEAANSFAKKWFELPESKRTAENAKQISGDVGATFEQRWKQAKEWADESNSSGFQNYFFNDGVQINNDREENFRRGLGEVRETLSGVVGDVIADPSSLDGFKAGQKTASRYGDNDPGREAVVNDRQQSWENFRGNGHESSSSPKWSFYYELGLTGDSYRYNTDRGKFIGQHSDVVNRNNYRDYLAAPAAVQPAQPGQQAWDGQADSSGTQPGSLSGGQAGQSDTAGSWIQPATDPATAVALGGAPTTDPATTTQAMGTATDAQSQTGQTDWAGLFANGGGTGTSAEQQVQQSGWDQNQQQDMAAADTSGSGGMAGGSAW